MLWDVARADLPALSNGVWLAPVVGAVHATGRFGDYVLDRLDAAPDFDLDDPLTRRQAAALSVWLSYGVAVGDDGVPKYAPEVADQNQDYRRVFPDGPAWLTIDYAHASTQRLVCPMIDDMRAAMVRHLSRTIGQRGLTNRAPVPAVRYGAADPLSDESDARKRNRRGDRLGAALGLFPWALVDQTGRLPLVTDSHDWFRDDPEARLMLGNWLGDHAVIGKAMTMLPKKERPLPALTDDERHAIEWDDRELNTRAQDEWAADVRFFAALATPRKL